MSSTPLVSFGARFGAAEENATKRPSVVTVPLEFGKESVLWTP